MGEANEPKKTALAQASEDAMAIDTMGGRMHVRWDETAQALSLIHISEPTRPY